MLEQRYYRDMQTITATILSMSQRIRELEAVEVPLGGGVGNHTILDGTVHTDSALQAVSQGSLIYGSKIPLWDELLIGANGTFLASDGADPAWRVLAVGDLPAHNLLSTTHADTVVNGATRGSLVYGNSTPAWDELVHPGLNRHLQTDANDVVWREDLYLNDDGFVGVSGDIRTVYDSSGGLIKETLGDAAGADAWGVYDSGGVGVTTVDSDGNLTLLDQQTAAYSDHGIIYKGTNRFIHSFRHPTGNTARPEGLNTFVGIDAGNLTMGATATATTEASYNVGVGYQALYSNTTGYQNTACGELALYSNAAGYQNTAYGDRALYSNTTGYQNTASGYLAGRYIDGSGANATGNNSVFLGYNTRANADGETNQIVIGASAIGLGSNTVVLGNSSIVTTALRGNVGIGETAPATRLELAETKTLTAGLTDGYSAALTLDPTYDGAFTVTRHNYIDVNKPALASGAAVTSAAVFRFDDAIGTHEALAASFDTTDSGADTTTWAGGILVNVNGTLYKIPLIAA